MKYPEINLLVGSRRIGQFERECRPVLNPATEEQIGLLPIAREADLEEAIGAAKSAFPAWRDTTPWRRGATLHEGARQVRLNADEIARALVMENGKPLSEAMAEVSAAADTLAWYAEEARRIYGRVFMGRAPESRFMTSREPLGVVALFAPWNFPVVTLVRKLAPALAAGCTIVAKPAEETPAAPSLLAGSLLAAGLPPGVLNLIFGDPSQISKHLIHSPDVAKISFTGSTAVGRALASLAGENLKRMTMELGGHGPAIICGDVDAIRIADMAAAAKFRNAGQVCNAASRFIVDRRIYEPFAARFAARASALKIDNGFDPAVEMGPLTNHRRVEAMAMLTEDAVASGGNLLAGGKRLDRPGFFFTPTVITDVHPTARVMVDEPFGPIAPIVPFDDIDEALELANSSSYGLAAYAMTNHLGTARKLTREIQAGVIGLNSFSVAFPEAPFGGIKNSGWGLEGGSEGIDAYLTTKFVHEA
ncbi:NAD-dependent succinate-semialdehyde dehydrogenase [Mesorhizobium qingshengii]|uniref:Succinate semialdehyde dehydrogenase n=1 Tax=Mesorhizobium qingshengii TaxID=1165689 RepID=A0A1G5Z8R5_9HYPH|nr:NAD-dependent succinate-semialdehyde dehydrogenase [Mesorhizobium qingshengii]SDA91419.1 succinate semialdehyde dehydrogenase [Mesorhizobium qingshengii]